MAYSGSTLPLELLLYKTQHSLIDQSMSSHSAETPTNGDGFGIGWYGPSGKSGLYRSIRPAWNDLNLRDLAGHIESKMLLAHVRATSQATVQETNCHPFRYQNWLFVHNGEIFEIEKLRRDLLFAIDPEYFPLILGTTDSEVMFFLALTFGLRADPPGAFARMAGFIEKVGKEHGVNESLWMTVAATDGESLWAVRYASDGQAPTLYHSRDIDDIYKINPDLVNYLGRESRMIVSEPVGRFGEMWEAVPQNTALHVQRETLELRPFKPC
jgi:glutamine amidotransferase